MSEEGTSSDQLVAENVNQGEAANLSTSHKRQRADTTGQYNPTKTQDGDLRRYSIDDIAMAVCSFDEHMLRQLLMQGAFMSTTLADTIHYNYQNFVKENSQLEIDFDYLSKSVWKAINYTHRSSKSSHQFDAAFGVIETVEEAITTIRKQIKSYSAFATKRSGLETLRKIGKTICLSSGNVIGHEVQKNFQGNNLLDDVMIYVVKCMTEDERSETCNIGNGEFLDKLEELSELARGLCLMEKLNIVLERLQGNPVDGVEHVPDVTDESESSDPSAIKGS